MSMLRTIVTSSRALITGAKDVSRFREIASAFVTHGFGWVFGQLKLRRELQVEHRGSDLTRAAMGSAETGRRLVKVFTSLGPTWVKFGQILSTRSDILPAQILAELASLQDAVAPLDFKEIEPQLDRNLGRDFRDQFASFDESPLASGSIAQVHRASLKDGRQVVLKIQRPGVGPVIRSDLHILRAIAGYLEEAFDEARAMSLQSMVDDFAKSLSQELDFQIEATNTTRFKKNLESIEQVYIPEVYSEFTTSEVLCIEYIDGRKFNEFIDDGGDVDPLINVYFDCAYHMLFVDGFFHGDLHPGNIFVLDDNRLALIDCGMVGRLAPSRKDKVIDVIYAMLNQDLEGVASTFYGLAIPQGHVDYQAFEADAIEVAERYLVGVPLSQVRIGEIFSELVVGATRHNVRLPTDFTMMFKAVITAEGLARTIAPDADPLAIAKPYIFNLMSERYGPERLKQLALTDLHIISGLARSLPRTLPALYDNLQRGKLTFGISPDSIRLQSRASGIRVAQIIRASFALMSMLCGTLALGFNSLTLSEAVGLPWVSVFFYVLAALLGVTLMKPQK